MQQNKNEWRGGFENNPSFLLYRKFLKQPEIVYNGQEIKNDMTKERRGLRHDVVMKFFVLV